MKTIKAAASVLLLSSASAFAADLPSIKSAPAPTPTPMWTGFYAGLNAGGTWEDNNTLHASTALLFTSQNTADLYTAAAFTGLDTFLNHWVLLVVVKLGIIFNSLSMD